MCGLVHQQTELECYLLSDAKPMQVVAQQGSDVVAASAAIYDSSSRCVAACLIAAHC